MKLSGSDYNINDLNDAYVEAYNSDKFRKLVKKLDVSDDIAMKYTSKLEGTVEDLDKCKGCKGLAFCKQENCGYVSFPQKYNNRIVFSLVPCKYHKEMIVNSKKKNKATMSDIYTDDKNRKPIINWMVNFLDNFGLGKNSKGLYINGNFGSGKTYLVSALFNELVKKGASCEIVYFPDMLKVLKGDFDNFGSRMNYYNEVDYLLLDDIGAEKVTDWGRDEILGTILQSRMENNKFTFFTSNLSLEALEGHLVGSGKDFDIVKARRIIERIKYLSDYVELIGKNRRV